MMLLVCLEASPSKPTVKGNNSLYFYTDSISYSIISLRLRQNALSAAKTLLAPSLVIGLLRSHVTQLCVDRHAAMHLCATCAVKTCIPGPCIITCSIVTALAGLGCDIPEHDLPSTVSCIMIALLGIAPPSRTEHQVTCVVM